MERKYTKEEEKRRGKTDRYVLRHLFFISSRGIMGKECFKRLTVHIGRLY